MKSLAIIVKKHISTYISIIPHHKNRKNSQQKKINHWNDSVNKKQKYDHNKKT